MPDIRVPGVTVALLALAACGGAPETAAPEPTPTATESPTTLNEVATNQSEAALPTEPRSCEAELGAKAAQALADQCRAVSPATRPPCNVANSCAMIREEIERSCDLFADDPPAECAKRPEGANAAAVVERYYAAIDARDYSTAYALWGDGGERSGKSADAFAQGFADTRSSTVRITGNAPVEGAAGSLYAEIPVEVTATLGDGRRQRFTGTYVLRRVNDVDGSTAAQRRWHIDSAKLKAA
jgi:hypothetical protein